MTSLTVEARLRGLEARVASLESGGLRKPAQPKTIAERIAVVDVSDMGEEGAMSVAQFCQRFKMSRSSFYNLVRQGRGPALVRANGRPLVSFAAAKAWRQRHEAVAVIEESEGDDAAARTRREAADAP
jgi:hypothetical protein